MFLLLTALFLGFLHGLGPDHLMAIAALSVDERGGVDSADGRRVRALGIAVRFAFGHALLLAVGAGLIVLIGWSIPAPVERGGEMLGGALLIVMGLVTLQHVRAHHAHLPLGAPFPLRTSHLAHRVSRVARRASHFALRASRPAPRASHSHLPTMIGAAFAVSSLRALAMLTPFGADLGTAPLPLLVTLIAVFACGILISMSLFGVALARLLSMRALERIGHGAGALVGVSSVVLGVAWVLTA